MADTIVVPRLGNRVESCVLVRWRVQEGDEVQPKTVVADVEAGFTGTVLKLLRTEGDDVPVLQPIAQVGLAGEAVPAGGAFASPRARVLAGTGPESRVVERDVRAALAAVRLRELRTRFKASEPALGLTGITIVGFEAVHIGVACDTPRGLTQSFALELVTSSITVNSLCPGNYFDGPLWSDPENGLFAQYLRIGTVPGARTLADVKTFYEAKVPMNRGCTGPDVLRALLYIVEQQYETGQAVPVTGG